MVNYVEHEDKNEDCYEDYIMCSILLQAKNYFDWLSIQYSKYIHPCNMINVSLEWFYPVWCILIISLW